MSTNDSALSVGNSDPPEQDWKDTALKWLEMGSKVVVAIAAGFGIYASIVIPKNLSEDSLRLQTKLAEQSVQLQKTIQDETSKREYVQMALAVLKENQERTDPRIRRLAAEIFIKNSPVTVDPGLEEYLASSKVPFPFMSPQLASTPKGKAFQLAGDMFGFVTTWALKLPEYGDLPKHTPIPEHSSKDYIYKQFVVKEFDGDFAKEFHKQFDARIRVALPGLEKALVELQTKGIQATCLNVNGVRSGEVCASQIFGGAAFRNPD